MQQLLHNYGALAHRAATLGRALRDQEGLRPGDRVGLFLANHPAVLEILFGCWWSGLVVVPINPKLHPREAHFILGHSGAARVFVSADGVQALQQQLAEAAAHITEPMPLKASTTPLALIDVDSSDYAALLAGWEHDPAAPPPGLPVRREGDDLAWLFYTSGTTGRPKGVMLSHRNLLTMTLCYSLDVDTVQPGDAALYAAPMSHGAGLYSLPHVAAAARHVVPVSRGFDVAEVLALAQHHGQVSMFAAPTMVRRLVDHAEATGSDGRGLKTVVYGGGPMYVEDIQRAMRVLGPRFVQIYGQGESPMTITALSRHHLGDHHHPEHLARLGSVGVAQTAVEVRVTSDQGDDLPVGEVGEVLVRGDTVMAGYWRDKAATARALRDGWLRTGDLGQLDVHGFLTLRDRSKDVIISGGSNIYPREVEEALLRHPDVVEVSVVGRPDPEWGEVVVAFVALRSGVTPDTHALDAVCTAHIARFKRPKRYHFVDSLPKNHYGKVLKTELRARLV